MSTVNVPGVNVIELARVVSAASVLSPVRILMIPGLIGRFRMKDDGGNVQVGFGQFPEESKEIKEAEGKAPGPLLEIGFRRG